MAETNVGMVRRLYSLLNQRDWDAGFRDAHPDMEMTTKRGLNAGTVRGRQGIQGFLEDYIVAFETVVWEPEEFLESGDQVVVPITTRSRPKGGSVDIVTRNGHLWTIRDATILSMETFPDPQEALQAAGLPVQGSATA